MSEVSHRPPAHSAEDVRPLHQLCREGRLYDVERWIADGKPLQLAPEAVPKGTRPKKALQIALETGQHSLATLLLRNGYRLDLERYAPLDLALRSRRWDLFDLLLDWGGDLMSVDAAAEDVRKSWPKLPVKIIDEPSHALFVAKPEEFNRVLEEFLTSLPK